MKCEQAIRLVEKLADGEADARETNRAESHLRECEDCRSHYEFLLALSGASVRTPLPEPPEVYWERLPSRVLARLDREEPRGFWQTWLGHATLRWGAAAAMLIVVAAVSITVLRDENVAEEPVRELAAQATPAREEAKAAVPEESPPVARDEPSPSPTRARQASPARSNEPASAPEAVELEESVEPAAPAAIALDAVAGEAAADEESEPREPRSPELAGVAGRRSALRAQVPTDCDRWREYLATNDEGPSATDARYELVRCSIRLFEAEGGEEARELAVRDADAFLADESEGPRAEEIRDAVAPLRR